MDAREEVAFLQAQASRAQLLADQLRDRIKVLEGQVGPLVPVTPTIPVPPPPVIPPPRDYTPWAGKSRTQIEYAVKNRYMLPLPDWFDWEEAYANGVVRDVDYNPGPAMGTEDYYSPVFNWRPGGSSRRHIDSPEGGSVFSVQIPIPWGYRGTIVAKADGERGGARIEKMDLWLSYSPNGEPLTLDGARLIERGAMGHPSFTLKVTADLPALYLCARTYNKGLGYFQLNVL